MTKKLLLTLALLLSCCASAFSQSITAQTVYLPLSSIPQPPAMAGPPSVVGQPGSSTYYFWLVSEFTVGNSSPSPVPGICYNAPQTLTSGNYCFVSWNSVIGASSYDLLMTTTPVQPSGACNCSVVTATSSTSVHVQSNSLNSYTVATFNPASLLGTIDNEPTGSGASQIIFRVGGIQQSIGGGIAIVGTPVANQLTQWTSALAAQGKSWADLDSLQYVAGGATAQAQTVTLASPATSLVAGLEIKLLPAAANTAAAPTLAVNGLAAKPITKLGTTALIANDLTATAIASVIYDGTEFQLQNPQTAAGGLPCSATALSLQFNNAGAFGCLGNATYVAATGVLSLGQLANSNNTLFMSRFTDTSPTGNFITLQNAAKNANLFNVDVSGNVSAAGSYLTGSAVLTGCKNAGVAITACLEGTEAGTSGTPTLGTDYLRWDSGQHRGSCL